MIKRSGLCIGLCPVPATIPFYQIVSCDLLNFIVRNNNVPFWNPRKTEWVNSSTGNFNYFYIFAVILDSVAAFTSGILIIIGFKYALYSGLNQGVMTSLFSLTSIYIALISYWLFKEALHIFHFIGMVFLVA